MEEKTVILKIREFDPLCVAAERLTAESSVFRFLIDEIRETELELDDFDPNTVYLFLTILDDKNVTEIEECRFRELHKMAVVFNVEWLIGQCRDWLLNKINQLECPADYEANLYLFEECRYILNKWNESKLMDLLLSKHATMDNTAFISRYMHSYDSLEAKQLDLLMKLSGSNTKVILETIILNINKPSLDDKTRYLLQNINLPLCFEKDEELYHQMFEKLTNLSQLTLAELKMISELLLETGRKVFHRMKRSQKSTSTLFDREKWRILRNSCNTLNDVISLVGDGLINNMFAVVKLLIRRNYLDHHPPTTEDAEVFVKTLENTRSTKPLRKVSYHYIDKALSALKLSEHPNRYQLIALLELVRNSDQLCSDQDYVHLVSHRSQGFKEEQSTDGTVAVRKYPFEYRHPGIFDCQLPGKCGFVIKYTYNNKKRHLFKAELCTDEKDYNSCGLHYHDIVGTEDINQYTISSVTKQDGTKQSGLLATTANVFPSDMIWKREQQCVDYYINIRDYLVAKQ